MRLTVALSLAWASSFALAQDTNATSAMLQALSGVLPSCAVCESILWITVPSVQHELTDFFLR